MESILIKLGPVVAVDEKAVENYRGIARAHVGLVRAVLDKIVNGEVGESKGGVVCNGLLEMARKIAEGNLAPVIAYQGKQDKFQVKVREEKPYSWIVLSSSTEKPRRFWAVAAAVEVILKELGAKSI